LAWLKITIETKRKNGKLLAIDHWPRVINFFGLLATSWKWLILAAVTSSL